MTPKKRSAIRDVRTAIILWIPVVLYTGVIFWLSSESRPIPGIETFQQMDGGTGLGQHILPHGYQDISLTTQQGKIVRFEKTTKYKVG